jgi:hypothetical protein
MFCTGFGASFPETNRRAAASKRSAGCEFSGWALALAPTTFDEGATRAEPTEESSAAARANRNNQPP